MKYPHEQSGDREVEFEQEVEEGSREGRMTGISAEGGVDREEAQPEGEAGTWRKRDRMQPLHSMQPQPRRALWGGLGDRDAPCNKEANAPAVAVDP